LELVKEYLSKTLAGDNMVCNFKTPNQLKKDFDFELSDSPKEEKDLLQDV